MSRKDRSEAMAPNKLTPNFLAYTKIVNKLLGFKFFFVK